MSSIKVSVGDVNRRDRPSKVALTIAGSDSGGGAGIQADLKTFYAQGVFGTSAITAVTAQNTQGVAAVKNMESEFVGQQIDALAEDMNISSIKTGMLSNTSIIKEVAKKIKQHNFSNIVVDPVLVATSGDLLLEREAVKTMKEELLPLCDILTPNIPETETLTGITIKEKQDIETAGNRLLEMGVNSVLVKGGHGSEEAEDHLFYKNQHKIVTAPRVGAGTLHGTGCTMSAAICARLALREDMISAVTEAKQYITRAINESFAVGNGSVVLNH